MNAVCALLDCRVVERSAATTRLVVVGEIDLLTITGFRSFLGEEVARAAGGTRIELDLSAVTYFAAATIRALVEADEAGAGRAVHIRLSRTSPVVDLVLRACGEQNRFPSGAASGRPGSLPHESLG